MKRPETNKFVLNEDNKRKSDRHPSHKGVLDVEGTLYWIGGWYNESQYGTYFKGDVRPVTDEEIDRYFREQPSKGGSKPAPKSVAPSPTKLPVVIEDDIDDELPF